MLKKLSCLLLIGALVFIGSCQTSGQNSPAPAPAPPPSQPEPEPAPTPAPAPQPAPAAEPARPRAELPPPKETGNVIMEGAQVHKVVWGDTLSRIALRYYGKVNGYYYPLIIMGNPGITDNPDLIIAGDQLRIPDLRRNLDNAAARAELKAYMEELTDFYNRKPDRVMSENLRALADKL